MLSRIRRGDMSLAFALVDLDRFKTANDTYGHPIGDQVLKTMSNMLKKRLRMPDLIGRYGGE
ncbi:MAG: GGDEF domain-containing protein [Pseudomonadota bacterium]|nr:GGDEF domain-containing protein [Pseudomonadota bacterium]